MVANSFAKLVLWPQPPCCAPGQFSFLSQNTGLACVKQSIAQLCILMRTNTFVQKSDTLPAVTYTGDPFTSPSQILRVHTLYSARLTVYAFCGLSSSSICAAGFKN